MEEGTRVKVFKEKDSDIYHKTLIKKTGTLLKEYPNFYLVLLDDHYKECFYKNEVYKIDEDIESNEERVI